MNKKFFNNDKNGHIIESIIDGEKGLSFKFSIKLKDEDYNINVKEIENDKFNVIEKKKKDETTKEVTMQELKKIIKSNKNLDFVEDYLKIRTKTQKGGDPNILISKKQSKKGSKKGSKKDTVKKSTKKQ